MRRFAMYCAVSLALLMSVGCGSLKRWVVTTARDTAIKVANNQLTKLHQRMIVPKIEKIEMELGQKLDKNGDEVWSKEEILDMIKAQTQQLSGSFATTAKHLTAKLLGVEDAVKDIEAKAATKDDLKDVPTRKETVKGLLSLIVLFILTKLGVKVGKKGIDISGLLKKKKDSVNLQ